MRQTYQIFLSTLSLRRATSKPRRLKSRRILFLSTLSLRRATIRQRNKLQDGRISIHALLAESDRVEFKLDFINKISIHALLAESDAEVGGSNRTIIRFLSTLSLRRATDDFEPSTTRRLTFLSTLSLRRATQKG